MKKPIVVHIIPLTRYMQNISNPLNIDQENTLPLIKLDKALNTLSKKYKIVKLEVEGGEIALLSDLYLSILISLLKIYCQNIEVFSNFLIFNKPMINLLDGISVNFNFDKKINIEGAIFDNIRAAVENNKSIHIKTNASHCIRDVIYKINKLNVCKPTSWEIIPDNKISNKIDYIKVYEEVVINYLKLTKHMKFTFINKIQLDTNRYADNYCTQHIYIIPTGDFAKLDIQNSEFKLTLINNLNEIDELEKKHTAFCRNCASKLYCMKNAYFDYTYTNSSCSGFKSLINIYKNEKRNEFNATHIRKYSP